MVGLIDFLTGCFLFGTALEEGDELLVFSWSLSLVGLESVSDSGSELDDDETSEDTSELKDCIEESDSNSPEGG